MKQRELDNQFPDLDAARAVEVYLEDGPTALAAKRLGVSQDLFRRWVASPEGRKAIDLAKVSLNALLDLGLTKIINQASARVLDVLEHGTKVMDKNGKVHEVGMSGKEAAAIFALVFDRRQLLRKQPTQIGGELDTKLEELAQKLRYLGGVPPGRDLSASESPKEYIPNDGTPPLPEFLRIGGTGDVIPESRYSICASEDGN